MSVWFSISAISIFRNHWRTKAWSFMGEIQARAVHTKWRRHAALYLSSLLVTCGESCLASVRWDSCRRGNGEFWKIDLSFFFLFFFLCFHSANLEAPRIDRITVCSYIPASSVFCRGLFVVGFAYIVYVPLYYHWLTRWRYCQQLQVITLHLLFPFVTFTMRDGNKTVLFLPYCM